MAVPGEEKQHLESEQCAGLVTIIHGPRCRGSGVYDMLPGTLIICPSRGQQSLKEGARIHENAPGCLFSVLVLAH